MFKTQEEVLKWLLEHDSGKYSELVDKAGKNLTRQLELLGYIRRGANTSGNTYALTRRGRIVALALFNLTTEKEEKRTKEKVTNFEKFIFPLFKF